MFGTRTQNWILSYCEYICSKECYPYWQSSYSIYDNPYVIWNPISLFSTNRNNCISKTRVDFKSYMRLLWQQHVAWTRMAILSIIFNLPDVNFTITRLLQNAPDMGNSLKPFYGENAALKYSNLIKDHLVIAADLVKAAKAGDQNAASIAEKNGTPMQMTLLNS